MNFQRFDTDGNSGVGLVSTWSHTGVADNGNVTIPLTHQPGVKDGTCEPGETDVEVTFVIEMMQL